MIPALGRGVLGGEVDALVDGHDEGVLVKVVLDRAVKGAQLGVHNAVLKTVTTGSLFLTNQVYSFFILTTKLSAFTPFSKIFGCKYPERPQPQSYLVWQHELPEESFLLLLNQVTLD